MDKYNVEKAIITTINRIKFSSNNDTQKSNNLSDVLGHFRRVMLKGQISHQDVIDIANKAPDRFFKLFWFNPNVAPEEEQSSYKILEEHFNKGFCGVKIHPVFHLVRIPRDIIKLVSFMQEYNKELILYIHSAPKTALFRGVKTGDIAKLALKFPELRIILGHAAYSMEYAMEVGMSLKDYKNIFFETSASVSYGIYRLIRMIGDQRIIFGSDSPVVSPIQIEIDKILTLPISDEEKQDILYNNVNKLLEFCRK